MDRGHGISRTVRAAENLSPPLTVLIDKASRPPSLKRWLVKCERMAAKGKMLGSGGGCDGEEIPVALAEEEQQELKGLVGRGRAVAYRQTHARILLLCDENQANGSMKDEEIARALKVGTATVERVRRRCVEESLERSLGRKEQLNRRPKKLDGHDEAQLIALACSQPPEGRASWTLQLLADRLVECEIVDSISTETVRQTLKKTNSSLG